MSRRKNNYKPTIEQMKKRSSMWEFAEGNLYIIHPDGRNEFLCFPSHDLSWKTPALQMSFRDTRVNFFTFLGWL